jgi:hypothetical protein
MKRFFLTVVMAGFTVMGQEFQPTAVVTAPRGQPLYTYGQRAIVMMPTGAVAQNRMVVSPTGVPVALVPSHLLAIRTNLAPNRLTLFYP